MAEQTFKSPGFYPREVDIGLPTTSPQGTPAGVIGVAQRGPAFIPVTVASLDDFIKTFGDLNQHMAGPYALAEYLKTQQACTYMRVLGAGSNNSAADFLTTARQGTVRNAGFRLSGSEISGKASSVPGAPAFNSSVPGGAVGAVTFINALHEISGSQEGTGFPMFSQNDSFPVSVLENLQEAAHSQKSASGVVLTRAMILVATGTRLQLLDGDNGAFVGTDIYPQPNVGGPSSGRNWTDAAYGDQATPFGDFSTADSSFVNTEGTRKGFKLVISSSTQDFGAAPSGLTGLRVLTASLDPSNINYISNVLNTDPLKFQQESHLLYAHWPVDHDICRLSPITGSVALCSGSKAHSNTSGEISPSEFLQAYGRFDARYTSPRTTMFISQPYAGTEWDLFYLEALDDGAHANDKFKASISNLRKSADPSYPYPSFDVEIRKFTDTDKVRVILESFTECNLDARSSNYIGKRIGDIKYKVNFDSEYDDEKNIIVTGQWPVKSAYVRVQLSKQLKDGDIPKSAGVFGFRGIPTLKTTNSLTDLSGSVLSYNGVALGQTNLDAGNLANKLPRLWSSGAMGASADPDDGASPAKSIARRLRFGIVPPLPFRFKCTKGALQDNPTWVGQAGADERANKNLYWGVQNTLLVASSSQVETGLNNTVLQPNAGATLNRVVDAYTKFVGIKKMDTLVTGTGADVFNNNKFTLSRVALRTQLDAAGHISFLTGALKTEMKEAAYIRNGVASTTDGTIIDPKATGLNRITFATLFATSSAVWNRFSPYAKFTNVFYGGFDGLNILDKDQFFMNDRATSADVSGGKAATDYTDSGLGTQTNGTSNPAGTGNKNQNITAYNFASRIMTNKYQSMINILAVPGIRSDLVTDTVSDLVREYGLAIYIMDIPGYDENGRRLYADSVERPQVKQTTLELEMKNIDNNYVATYFPDVFATDPQTGRIVRQPASNAVLGALGLNDRMQSPWFAPAGFSRGSLASVSNTTLRLAASDRDTLYEGRINPIATLPTAGSNNNPGFVIFGQKNLQSTPSALDRVNVRRMLLELKRQIINVARRLLFEQNTPAVRSRFVSNVTPILASIQAAQGIERFRVVMDDTNNTESDRLNHRLNGRIIVVPTRSVEFIAMDFIIDQAGVTFQ